MPTPHVTLTVAEQLGLLPEEFEQIINILGRTPTFTELSLFAAMWSERISYKNSILQLRSLPDAGDNGNGLIKLDNDQAMLVNIESFHLPTAIEPDQEPAIGIEGIYRRIYSTGAHPMGSINSLCLGPLDLTYTPQILKSVGQEITEMENSFNAAARGEGFYVDSCYEENPLLNIMSIGLVEKDNVTQPIAHGVGNPIILLGRITGREGIHSETLLMEATHECIETGGVIGSQAIGLGGIGRATSEMAAKGQVGMNIRLDKVPIGEQEGEAFDVLVSASLGSTVFAIQKGKEADISLILEKFGIPYAQIGEVVEGDEVVYFWQEEQLARIPAQSLVQAGGAPVYQREQREPAYFEHIRNFDPSRIAIPAHHNKVIKFLLARPGIAGKRWKDASLLSQEGQAVSMTCNSRYVYSNPEQGSALAVAEAARKLICMGATPLATSTCLNFGNPYNPEVYYQFAQAIQGIGDACRSFDTPISGSTVSFYNQSDNGPIFPTPVIGMLGVITDPEKGPISQDFQQKGDQLFLLGRLSDNITSSEYVYAYHDMSHSPAPYVNLEEEKALQEICLALIAAGLIQSAHNIAEGGLIISLLESAFPQGLGFELKTPFDMRKDGFLYGEAGGRIVVSVATEKVLDFSQQLNDASFPFLHIGEVRGDRVIIDGEILDAVKDYQQIYEESLMDLL